MKKMKTTLGVMVSAAVCVLALAGCSRESMEKETSEVRFGFSSVPTTTRTEFEHAVTPSGTTSEQVRWNIADVVTICSDKAAKLDGTTHVSQYEVSGFKSESEHDIATVDNHGTGGGLRWADESSDHKFFAVYGKGASISMTGGVTGASIPATQQLAWIAENTVGLANMDYAYMVGVLETAYASTVTLPMRQMYTAFQFTVASGDNEAVGLTSFTLSSSSAALAGGFTVAYPADGKVGSLAVTPTSTDAKAITVNFPEDFYVVKDKPVTFTVLAMGQTLTNLSITFVGDVIGTRTLALKKNSGGDFITFQPSTKNLINGLSFPNLQEATGEDIIWEQTAIGEPISWQDDPYVLGHIDPSDLTYLGGTSTNGAVISYKVVGGEKVATPWTVLGYYPTQADAEAATNPYADLAATGWVSSYPAAGVGYGGNDADNGQSVSIDYGPADPDFETISVEDEINEAIRNSSFGTGSTPESPFNLANPANKTSDFIVESANSYVVNGPGYYKIPIVMGNGVKNNAIYEGIQGNGSNYKGLDYHPNGGNINTGQPYTKLFQDYKGQFIESPLVHKSNSTTAAATKVGVPTSAFVVWEDPLLIETDGNTSTSNGWNITNAIEKKEGALESGDDIYWLKFRVGGDGTEVKQGNAVIAVADESGTVMWSYHIWVTNYVPKSSSDIRVANTGGGSTQTYTLMPCNFGWVYKQVDNHMHYPVAEMYVRIRQDESGKVDVMKVVRPENSFTLNFHDGYGPSYQWGRKDALHPVGTSGQTLGSKNMNYMDGGRVKDFTFVQTNTSYSTKKYLYDTIKNPGTFYGEAAPNTVWSVYWAMRNMWNCNMEATPSGTYDAATDDTHTTAEKKDWVIGKTIYDPSPAGYSIPAPGALAFRTGDAINRIDKENPTLEDLANQNIAAMYTKTEGSTLQFIGYSFFTDENKTSTIFFPTSGYRSYSSGVMVDVGKAGYFWSAIRSNNVSGMDFTIYYNWNGSAGSVTYKNAYGAMLWHNMPQCDGFCIRPMQNDK